MQTKELDTKKAGFFAWAASRDAAIKSYAASTGYTDAQKLQAERVRLGLELCYHQSEIHINFRQKFIVVKIDNPQVKDRKNLKLLENDYSNIGITKQILKAGGIGYRIPRDN
jgi:hypothetical protein